MIDYTIKLTFTTPMFGHGATDEPEIRPSSIRGQLHSWFRLLGGTIDQERAVFGGIRQGKGQYKTHDETMASRVVVRVTNVKGMVDEVETLPHKFGNRAAPRKAYKAGTTCEVRVTDRLGGIKESADEELFVRALQAWLLMGTLGFRSTRAAGSFVWECVSFPMPTDVEAYRAACVDVLLDAPARFGILPRVYSREDVAAARRLVSDSLGGPDNLDERNDLQELHNPLGCIKPSRKTSPLKYRIICCGNDYRILALWDGREDVTGNTASDLQGVIDLLGWRKPELGGLLKNSDLYVDNEES